MRKARGGEEHRAEAAARQGRSKYMREKNGEFIGRGVHSGEFIRE